MPAKLTDTERAAIAAYSGTITICAPGAARAPARSPYQSRDANGLHNNAYMRAMLGPDFDTFARINSDRMRFRGALSAYLREKRLARD